eukprot:TRINITY_DN1426_c0_g1_i1.p1 TRINITY_DN1426_c0_g1~~TRINITY_DN1426_c0_g1_i1.p1  ORF type:complete len:393 (-),score=219.27 TRINITY_DN1426_c0_g1_i1:98-1276(-)
MLTTTLIVAMLAVNALAAEYDGKSEKSEKSEEVPEIGPEYYDEVYTTSANGKVWAVTAQHGETDWSEPQELASDLYAPQGVTVCNNAKDQWGRWAKAYVADAGDAEHPGQVVEYDIVRSAQEPGKIQLDNAKVVYGGGEMPAANSTEVAAAPTDVVCHDSGIFIADANKGQVQWKSEGNLKKDEEGAAWIPAKCENAVAKVDAAAVAGSWLYWAVQNEDAEKSNGIYRQKVSGDAAECEEEDACKGADGTDYPYNCDKGDEIEFFVQEEQGAYGVAVHNEKVLFTTGAGKVWSAGEFSEKDVAPTVEEWAEGYDEATAVYSAGDRGLLVADEDALYVTKGGDKKNKLADVSACSGVNYYEGLAWHGEEAEGDSASAVALAAGALVAAAAAFF